jgi:hypothetical protein
VSALAALPLHSLTQQLDVTKLDLAPLAQGNPATLTDVLSAAVRGCVRVAAADTCARACTSYFFLWLSLALCCNTWLCACTAADTHVFVCVRACTFNLFLWLSLALSPASHIAGCAMTGHTMTCHTMTGHTMTGHTMTGHTVTCRTVTGHALSGHTMTGHSDRTRNNASHRKVHLQGCSQPSSPLFYTQ